MQNVVTINELGFQNSLEAILAFFDNYPDTRAFIKDKQSRYIYANRAYANMLDTTPEAMIGLSDYDLYEANIADLYLKEDRQTLTGRAFVNQRWMVPDATGRIAWCISHKYPLRDASGEICGIFCTFRDFAMAGAEAKPYFDLSEAVEYIHQHYTEVIAAEDLADLLSISVSQLNRKFSKTLGRSPINYLMHVRINAAKDQLIESDKTVAEVGYACGFNSPAYFSRQFKLLTGMTPKAFRSQYGERKD